MIYVMSGGAKAFAVIGVTYPEGSVCTCTDGTKTLKLKDTSGQGFFLIPYAGAWTVTCTDGTNTKSLSVEITSEGQSESVELAYELVLYDGGQTVPWSFSERTSGSINLNSSGKIVTTNSTNGDHVVYATDKIDLTKYTKLYAHAKITKYGGVEYQKEHLCILNNDNAPTYSVVNNSSANTVSYSFFDTSEGDVVIDISSLTGQYYVGFKGRDSVWVSRVWLE